MEDYKLRFIKEHKELVEKLGKLRSIIERYEAGTLDFTPDCPIELLKKQALVMAEYVCILEERAQIGKVEL